MLHGAEIDRVAMSEELEIAKQKLHKEVLLARRSWIWTISSMPELKEGQAVWLNSRIVEGQHWWLSIDQDNEQKKTHNDSSEVFRVKNAIIKSILELEVMQEIGRIVNNKSKFTFTRQNCGKAINAIQMAPEDKVKWSKIKEMIKD